MRTEYHGEPLDERLTGKLQAILGAKGLGQGLTLAHRATDAAQSHYLSEWARKKIQGKVTIRSLETSAKKVTGLIRMLTKKGQLAGVATQEARLATIQAEIRELSSHL